MSYNNNPNYSYFNVPKTTADWWGAKDSQTVSAVVDISGSDGYSGKSFSPVTHYSGQVLTSTGKTMIASKGTYILPSALNFGGHSLTTPPTYTPPPYIPPLNKSIYTPSLIAGNTPMSTATYGSQVISPQIRISESTQPQHDVIQGTVTQLFSNFGFIDDNIIFSKADILGPMVNIGDKVTVDVTLQQNSSTKYKGERVCKLDINPFLKPNASQMTVINQHQSPRKETISKSSKSTFQVSVTLANKSQSDSHSVSVTNSAGNSSPKSRLELNKQSKLLERLSESLTPKKRSIETKDKTSDSKDKSNDCKTKSHDSKSNGSKDKSVDDKDKSQSKDTSLKNISKRSKISHNTDTAKPSRISPFKIQKSSKSDSRKRSPDSKAKCISKNYESFAFRELDCAALKGQCRTLPLPSELFHITLKYQQSYPLNHPMKLGNNCHFKILDKRVKPTDNFTYEQLNKNVNPQDADTTFVVRVMLLSTDDLAKFYKDTLTYAEEFDGDSKIPVTKAIKFLIGSMGEDKEFGIGGAWSPSLDGLNPESNPRVLINTAIRTYKSLTGIDLSECNSWPKFLELHYYRPLQKLHKKNLNGDIVIDLDAPEEWREPRMETVVYFIPDVWNIVPSQQRWNEIKRSYEEQLARIMCPPPTSMNQTSKISKDSQKTNLPTSPISESTNMTIRGDGEDLEEEDYSFNDNDDVDDKEVTISVDNFNLDEQPTHFSKLTLSTMKIVDIKRELMLRKLNNKGVMDQLKARLKSALEREENDEKNKVTLVITKKNQVVTNIQDTALSENEKNELKKLYVLPNRPEIIVHQNRKFKHMKMRTMSLHSLLSYYNIKLEESTFELAIFAKQFLDMLRRDAVFSIYKSIVVATDLDLINKEDSGKKAKVMVTTSKRTVNRPLLFSCTLLDREKTNKISLDDLKILIDGLGICLSSNQLCEVLAKVDNSKYLHYRQLTDKEMTDVDINAMMNTEVNEDFDYIKELALGNKALFEEETILMDTMINDEEIDRLRNELDKSERCRQILELKISEIKEETTRSCNLSKTQSKEIIKLKNQESEYRNKYHREKHRGDRYKHDFEKLFQQIKSVDKMTSDVNKFVSNIVIKFTKNSDKDQSSSIDSKMKKSNKSTNKKSNNTEVINDDVNRDNDKLEDVYDFEIREFVVEIEEDLYSSNNELLDTEKDDRIIFKDNANSDVEIIMEEDNEDDNKMIIGEKNNEESEDENIIDENDDEENVYESIMEKDNEGNDDVNIIVEKNYEENGDENIIEKDNEENDDINIIVEKNDEENDDENIIEKDNEENDDINIIVEKNYEENGDENIIEKGDEENDNENIIEEKNDKEIGNEIITEEKDNEWNDDENIIEKYTENDTTDATIDENFEEIDTGNKGEINDMEITVETEDIEKINLESVAIDEDDVEVDISMQEDCDMTVMTEDVSMI